LKMEAKKSKKNGNQRILRLIKVEEKLNVTELPLSDHHARIQYNPSKYLDAFYSAIEPVMLVFDQEIRDLLKVDVDSGVVKIPRIDLNSIQLINGVPLEGKEHNQQDKNRTMQVEEIEMRFWKETQMSPFWFLDKTKYQKEKYYLLENGVITDESEKTSALAIVNNIGAINFKSKLKFT
jgi:hypothetical protein